MFDDICRAIDLPTDKLYCYKGIPKYGLDKAAMSLAWILRHPSRMQPIAGTTNPERLKNLAKACDVKISREDFYALYLANNRQLP